MVIRHLTTISMLLVTLAAPLAAQTPDPPPPPDPPAGRSGRISRPNVKLPPLPPFVRDPEAVYDHAREAIENSQFDEALRELDRMVGTAKSGANPDLQLRAIRYLGMMGGAEDRELLAGIYRTSPDAAVKRAILQSYFMSGNVDKIAEVAKTEKDPELRRTAIRNLG